MLKFQFSVFALIVCLLLILNCNNKSQKLSDASAQSIGSALKDLATTNFGNNYSLKWNEAATHVIIISQDKKAGAVPFILFDNRKKENIYQDTVPGGKISWLNNYEVEVLTTPGQISDSDSQKQKFGYIFNILYKRRKNI